MLVNKHGNTYKEIRCENCYCEFSYIENDIKTALWSNEYYKYVKCPECGKIYKLEEA